jgi:integrase
MLKYQFSSKFARHIVDFIQKKRSFGYKYEETEYTLYAFDKFCLNNFPTTAELSQDVALKWAEKRSHEQVRYQLNRITAVRQLALYMNSVGVDAYVIPFGIHQKCDQTQRTAPYIYSKDELAAIFHAADTLEPVISSPAMHLVLPVMLRLIYLCGLRPAEARELHVGDVDLESGSMKILESKGHKDRVVVMANDMCELARKYDSKVSLIYPEREYFFANNKVRHGGMYSLPWSDAIFRKLLLKAGISREDGRNPRLYDLRHTFATHRIYEWLQDEADINACMMYLSEYMGHAHPSGTAYYIHLVPEFYPKMMALGLESSASIIPEVVM